MFVITTTDDDRIQVDDFRVAKESGVISAQRPDGRVLTLPPGSWTRVDEVANDAEDDEAEVAVQAFAGP